MTSNAHAGRVAQQLAMADRRDRVIEASDLTKFQTRILAILAEEDHSGQGVKRELQPFYDTEINHGRLYPNLDIVVEAGYVEKSELDGRTNNYTLTDEGRAVLEADVEWVRKRLDGGDH